MKRYIAYYAGILFVIAFFYLIWAAAGSKAHDFEGKCQLCHKNIPDKDMGNKELVFVDDIDNLCARCHTIDTAKSHPTNITPDRKIPLAMHLDKNGRMTCATCHDVHKEGRASGQDELPGLLWGHVKGKEFCFLCHDQDGLGAGWRHQTAVPYAHSSGKLIENSGGGLLDRFSVECLSCHDGTISKSPHVEVRQGVWKHGIGMSHPVGIDYPREGEFHPQESLPEEVRLFEGRVGCLSCHEIYGREKDMLVMNNKGSRLCLACHKK